MADRVLPTGTVTFLFSDMEGSTQLVQDVGPEVFTRVLEQHNAILREAFARHDGVERGTQGDSFLVMFRDAPAAVSAAAEAQAALHRASWPDGATVRVRMGLHTGIGTLGGDDYVGVDVNRAARIAALAHGGQVLLSDATRALTEGGLARGLATRPLGEFKLKDLTRPERLHQLVGDGLRSEFPALRSARRTVGNLPAGMSTFIGRDAELAELATLLDVNRLVTLTGPGGTGKTRLAMEFARSHADHFEDGVWLVALEAVRDPALVASAIASSLGMVESPGSTPTERLTAYLADRSILLVLDNFEQVLGAAPVAAELLHASAQLRVLVTSRAPLRLAAEQEFPVVPLALPGVTDGVEATAAADSVRLFVERARRARPGYELSARDAPAVAELCRRLDGLPLGIELAAARVSLLPPTALAQRLVTRLDVPGAGARDRPARQQTLERTLAWSYDLLEDPGRRLLAALSVFGGGFRLVEAEAVGTEDGEPEADTIDVLAALLDHSLVQSMNGPDVPRFRLLETVRMFAGARLAERGQVATMRTRHARAYLALAEEAAGHMPGRGQVSWLDRLSVEHDNLRAALAWAVESGDAEIAHRLVAASWRFWQFRGHVGEGRARAAEVLAMPGADSATTWRMRGLEAAGSLEWWGADVPRADALYQAQLDVARAIGDERGTADALFNLIHTRFTNPDARPELVRMHAEAEAIYGQVGDERALARLAWTEGYALMERGETDEAHALVGDLLRRFEQLGDEFYIALASSALAGLSFARGDLEAVLDLGIRGLLASHALSDIASITFSLRTAATLWLVAGLPGDAATLYAAFEAHCRRYGVRPPADVESWMGLGATAQGLADTIGSAEFDEQARRGSAMTTDEILEFITGEAQARFRGRVGTKESAG